MSKRILITKETKRKYPVLCATAENEAKKQSQSAKAVGISNKKNLKIHCASGFVIAIPRSEMNSEELLELVQMQQLEFGISTSESGLNKTGVPAIRQAFLERVGEERCTEMLKSKLAEEYPWALAYWQISVKAAKRSLKISGIPETPNCFVPYSVLLYVEDEADIQKNQDIIFKYFLPTVQEWAKRYENGIRNDCKEKMFPDVKNMLEAIVLPHASVCEADVERGRVSVRMDGYTGHLTTALSIPNSAIEITYGENGPTAEVTDPEMRLNCIADRVKRMILSTPLLVVSPVPNAEKELKSALREYNKNQIKWLTGKSGWLPLKCTTKMYVNEGCVRVESAVGDAVIMGKEIKIVYTETYKAAAALMKKKLYVRCMNAALETFGSPYIVSATGDVPGILYGDTPLELKRGKLSVRYLYKTPSWELSVQEWKAVLKRNIKEIEQIFADEQKKYDEAQRKRYEQYNRSFLMQDIFAFVRENEVYITEAAVIQALRGVKVQLDTSIRPTDAIGRYNAISEGDISTEIERMMRLGYLWRKPVDWKYGTFYLLKTQKDPIQVSLYESTENSVTRKQQEGKVLADPEALLLMKSFLRKGSLEPADYMTLLDLLKYPAAAVRCLDSYKAAFAAAPKEIREFAKIQKSVAGNTMRKLLTEVLRLPKKA